MRFNYLSFAFALAIVSYSTIGVIAQTPNYVPVNGLVGWWPFNGNANDESGNGNNGVNSGATLTTDRHGQIDRAYSFNGTSNYISLGNLNMGSESYSVSVWVNTSVIPSGNSAYRGVLGKGSWGEAHGGDHTFLLVFQSNHWFQTQNLVVGYENSAGSDMLLPYDTIANFVGNWQHIVAVYNHSLSKLEMHLNGMLATSLTTSIQPHVNNVHFIVGHFFAPPHSNTAMQQSFFSGKIDDIGVWNRALDRKEITDLFIADSSSNTTSLHSLGKQSGLNIYPNPASTEVTLDYPLFNTSGETSITVLNVAGQVVLSAQLKQQVTTFDISGLNAKGVYFVQLRDSANALIETRKVVIN